MRLIPNFIEIIIIRRERKYFPVHKVSKRMSNTFRRIYKQNLQLTDQGYPSAPEHQSSQSENTPDSPVKSCLYAELDGASQARSVIVPSQQQQNGEFCSCDRSRNWFYLLLTKYRQSFRKHLNMLSHDT